MYPRPSLRKWGSRKESSLLARGYSRGQVSSFQPWRCDGQWKGRGTNLFQALGNVPPGVAMAPMRALRRNRVRETCQPTRFQADAERQLWVDSRVPAPATASATSARVAAGIPVSASANSKVYSA